VSLVEQGELTFWNTSRLAKCYGKNIALIENEVENVRTVSYQELDHLVIEAKQKLSRYHCELNNKLLIMLVANNSIDSVVYYLAALQLDHSVWWVEKNSNQDSLHDLQAHYGVNLLINNGDIQTLDSTPVALHDD
jgi:long-subunit acyl-CoA synthetase (AMP-forming)